MKKHQRDFLIILTILLGLAFPLINKTQQSLHSDKARNRFDKEITKGARSKINKFDVSINDNLRRKLINTRIPDSSKSFEYKTVI
jgi:hypothetical protein